MTAILINTEVCYYKDYYKMTVIQGSLQNHSDVSIDITIAIQMNTDIRITVKLQ